MPRRSLLCVGILIVGTTSTAGDCNRWKPEPIPSPAPAEAQSIVIRGVVTDEATNGVNGVSIRATGAYPLAAASGTLTDANGRFSLVVTIYGAPGVAATVNLAAGRMGYYSSATTVTVEGRTGNTYDVSFRLSTSMAPLVVGATIAASVSSADGPCYVGEPYESDYSVNCTFFSLRTPEDTDVRVELGMAPPLRLQVWAVEGWTVIAGTPGSDAGTAMLVVPRGKVVQLVVGPRYPGSAPATSLAFTLTASALPGTLARLGGR